MSAPKEFFVYLDPDSKERLGTPADRALLRLYFMAGGFDPELADASVMRWSGAIDPKEFEAKLAQATEWATTVVFEVIKDDGAQS
jgi:hypothetical protein